MHAPRTLALSRHDVAVLLTLDDGIDAVESAFRAHGEGLTSTGILGMPAAGGGFHIKAATIGGDAPVFAAKVNGNFQDNAARFGLPRIQGLIVLCDARHGFPLAVMDSTLITQLRTGAATAVAAKYLARTGASIATIVGCGLQGRVQLRSIVAVRPLTRVFVHDADRGGAERFAREMTAGLRCEVLVIDAPADGTRQSDLIVTCTPSRVAILHEGDVVPGAFISAVGADSEDKQEIAPALMARCGVVPDILEQAATIGDLHHALVAGAMCRADARAELGAIVAGRAPGRTRDDEIMLFDSTGTALHDVAAAALVLERAERRGAGTPLDLLGTAPRPRASAGNEPLFRVTL